MHRRRTARVLLDDRHRVAQRSPRKTRDLRAELDANESMEQRRRRTVTRPSTLPPARRGLRQQRKHQAGPASHIDERPLGRARRQHSPHQNRPIQRIPAELAARELPRRDAAGDEPIRGPSHERGEKRIFSWIACQQPGRTADRQTEDRSDDDRTDQDVGAQAPRVDLLDGFNRQRPQLAAPDERAGLKLGQDQERRHERVGNVRGQIQLDAIEAQQRACRQADREMEAVEGQTSDEHAQADGCRITSRPAPFGSEVVHESPHLARHGRTAGDAGHADQDAGAGGPSADPSVTLPTATSCPSALTSPSIL